MVRVKICGLTRQEDAALALRLGAWALGFIFHRPSPRYIEPEAVAALLTQLKSEGLQPHLAVGVFVNADAKTIHDYARRSGVDTVQLHGDEDPALLEQIEGLGIIKAFRLRSAEQLAEIAAFEDYAEAFLFDAALPGQYGGTGQLSDWHLVAQVRSAKPLILSGGLNADNVVAAYKQLQPYALDLSSGVEERPGIKDPVKLHQLFQQLGAAYA